MIARMVIAVENEELQVKPWARLKEEIEAAKTPGVEKPEVTVSVSEVENLMAAAIRGVKMAQALKLLTQYPDQAVRNVATAGLKGSPFASVAMSTKRGGRG